MLLHGLDADAETGGNLTAAITLRHQFQDLPFPLGEGGATRQGGHVPVRHRHRPEVGDRLAQEAGPPGDAAHPLRQILAAGVLGQEAISPGTQRALHIFQVAMHRQNHHPCPRRHPLEALDRLQPVHAGHGDIQQDDVGPQVTGAANGLPAVSRLADHQEIGLGIQNGPQTLAQDAVILHHQDSCLLSDHDPASVSLTSLPTPSPGNSNYLCPQLIIG